MDEEVSGSTEIWIGGQTETQVEEWTVKQTDDSKTYVKGNYGEITTKRVYLHIVDRYKHWPSYIDEVARNPAYVYSQEGVQL